MIRCRGLRKSFQDGDTLHEVLSGVDFELAPGRFVALIGRSGSGKSTLLNCLAGLERPDQGEIWLGETRLDPLPDAELTRTRRDSIGIIFQFFNLIETLNVRENVALPGLLAGRPRKEVLEKAAELLTELGLGDRLEARTDQLSGGEQQRVATARALINDPAVLLADEPTGNLDAETARSTLELLGRLHEERGLSILMVTHSPEAAAIAQTVATMEKGRIEMPPEPEPEPEPEPAPAEPASE